MRFLRRMKIVFDAEVKLQRSDAEPQTSLLTKTGRFRDLDDAENVAVERPGAFFLAPRHGQLNVMKCDSRHAGYSLSYFRSRRKHRPSSRSKTTQESMGRE